MKFAEGFLAVACAAVVLMSWSTDSYAAQVSPQLGGGSGGVAVNMKHVAIGYDAGGDGVYGTGDDAMHVEVDEVLAPGAPLLRPLDEGDAFSAGPWAAALGGKAYNHQYGWVPGEGLTELFTHFGAASVPGDIWVRLISQTPGLETYQTMMMPGSGDYAPIFTTGGAPAIWDWRHGMQHNAYAVADPLLGAYEAVYEVYVADGSGNALPGFASSQVVFVFQADAVPEPGSLALLAAGAVGLLRRRGA